MKTALIVLNIQNDYCDYCENYKSNSDSDDTLDTINPLSIIPQINNIRDKFDHVIFVKDWYPKSHVRFTKQCTKIYCIQNTPGAELNPGLIVKDKDFIIHKGTLELYDSDSAFYNAKLIGKSSKLNSIITENNITALYFCGMLPEEIVFSTVIDAYKFKHQSITIIKDLCAGLNSTKIERGYKYLSSLGINIVDVGAIGI